MQEAKDVNLKVGEVYFHRRKQMYKNAIRRKLRIDALYTTKGINGKTDKSIVACTDLNSNQPYQPLLAKNFLKKYARAQDEREQGPGRSAAGAT